MSELIDLTAAQAKELVQRVGHPNFHTMYDTFHANIEEKNAAHAIRELAGHFVHVHISESDRGIPGTGMVHWDETFRASLTNAGFPPLKPQSEADTKNFVDADRARWFGIVKTLNITLD